jgi:hypothetical protein
MTNILKSAHFRLQGKELCDTLGCETAGDVQKIPEAVLIEKLGEKMGPWVYRAVRGVHDEPVMTRQISKSMLAAKSYSQTNNMDDVRWASRPLADFCVLFFDAQRSYAIVVKPPRPHGLEVDIGGRVVKPEKQCG